MILAMAPPLNPLKPLKLSSGASALAFLRDF